MNINKASREFTRSIVKIVIYAIFILILYFIGLTAYKYGQKVFSDAGMEKEPGTDIYVMIPDNSSAGDVGKLLESYGLVEDSFIFRIQTFIYEGKTFVGGEYKFNTSYNAEKMIDMLKDGPEEETKEEESTKAGGK